MQIPQFREVQFDPGLGLGAPAPGRAATLYVDAARGVRIAAPPFLKAAALALLQDVTDVTAAAGGGVTFQAAGLPALTAGASSASGWRQRLWVIPSEGSPDDDSSYEHVLLPTRALHPARVAVVRMTTDEHSPDFHSMVTSPEYLIPEEQPREQRKPDMVSIRWVISSLESSLVRDGDGEIWRHLGTESEEEGLSKVARRGNGKDRSAALRRRTKKLAVRADPAVATAAHSAQEAQFGAAGRCAKAVQRIAQPVSDGGIALADVRRLFQAPVPCDALIKAACSDGNCGKAWCLFVARAHGAVLDAALEQRVKLAVASVAPSTPLNSRRNSTFKPSSPGAGIPVTAGTGSGSRTLGLDKSFAAAATTAKKAAAPGSSASGASSRTAASGSAANEAAPTPGGLSNPFGAQPLAPSGRGADGAPPAQQPPSLAPAKGPQGRGGGNGDTPPPQGSRTAPPPAAGTSRSLPTLPEGTESMSRDPTAIQGWIGPYSAVLNTPAVDDGLRPLVSALAQAFAAKALALETVYTYEALSSMLSPPLAQQLDGLMEFLEENGHVTSGGGNGGDETITFHTQPTQVVTSL